MKRYSSLQEIRTAKSDRESFLRSVLTALAKLTDMTIPYFTNRPRAGGAAAVEQLLHHVCFGSLGGISCALRTSYRILSHSVIVGQFSKIDI